MVSERWAHDAVSEHVYLTEQRRVHRNSQEFVFFTSVATLILSRFLSLTSAVFAMILAPNLNKIKNPWQFVQLHGSCDYAEVIFFFVWFSLAVGKLIWSATPPPSGLEWIWRLANKNLLFKNNYFCDWFQSNQSWLCLLVVLEASSFYCCHLTGIQIKMVKM